MRSKKKWRRGRLVGIPISKCKRLRHGMRLMKGRPPCLLAWMKSLKSTSKPSSKTTRLINMTKTCSLMKTRFLKNLVTQRTSLLTHHLAERKTAALRTRTQTAPQKPLSSMKKSTGTPSLAGKPDGITCVLQQFRIGRKFSRQRAVDVCCFFQLPYMLSGQNSAA